MARAYVDTKLCKECLKCVQECPKEAIYPLEKLNSKGYKVVGIIGEKCTGCGVCYTVCPDYCFEIRSE